MKAAVIRQFGDFDVLKVEDVQTPKPKPGHVLVKVLAAGVNRLDHNLREGSVVPELPFPHILGGEAVGEVFALGRNVTGREIGERVIVVPDSPSMTPRRTSARPSRHRASPFQVCTSRVPTLSISRFLPAPL